MIELNQNRLSLRGLLNQRLEDLNLCWKLVGSAAGQIPRAAIEDHAEKGCRLPVTNAEREVRRLCELAEPAVALKDAPQRGGELLRHLCTVCSNAARTPAPERANVDQGAIPAARFAQSDGRRPLLGDPAPQS
jgi:hypothetical protein